MQIEFITGDNHSLNPGWLDLAKTPKARREIRTDLLKVMAEENGFVPYSPEGSMSFRVKKRANGIIRSLYAQLAQEYKLDIKTLRVSLGSIEELSDHQKRDALFRSIGLSEEGFRRDPGRTSKVWEIVEQLIAEQNLLLPVTIPLPDVEGALAEVTKQIYLLGYNIVTMELENNDDVVGTGILKVTFNGNDRAEIKSNGEHWFIQKVTHNVTSSRG